MLCKTSHLLPIGQFAAARARFRAADGLRPDLIRRPLRPGDLRCQNQHNNFIVRLKSLIDRPLGSSRNNTISSDPAVLKQFKVSTPALGSDDGVAQSTVFSSHLDFRPHSIGKRPSIASFSF
ncbi:hypothetical protein AAFO90_00025 [Phaeobacter sp. CAU 1743]|uniref:hypothetical protein n=1 Tax=Phaeobacter sp. CAU 1743 TaxID=3140367 RepID=UPI00325B6DBF